jgi:dodecin
MLGARLDPQAGLRARLGIDAINRVLRSGGFNSTAAARFDGSFRLPGWSRRRRLGRGRWRTAMQDHVYRIIEVAGSSDKSIEGAIESAVARASRTLRHLAWFEVLQTRGHIEDGKVRHYQVVLKVGFTLEDA